MKLREKVEMLLTVTTLEKAERQMLQLTLDVNGDSELEGLLYPEVESHVEGRFEWFFTPSGTLRRKTA